MLIDEIRYMKSARGTFFRCVLISDPDHLPFFFLSFYRSPLLLRPTLGGSCGEVKDEGWEVGGVRGEGPGLVEVDLKRGCQ